MTDEEMPSVNDTDNNDVTEQVSDKPKTLLDVSKQVLIKYDPDAEGAKKYGYWVGVSPYHASAGNMDPEHWKPVDPDDYPHLGDWAQAVDEAFFVASAEDYPQKEVSKDLGKWKQSFTHGTMNIGIMNRSGDLGKIKGNTKTTGRAFLTAVRTRQTSNGMECMFPLHGTGIWVGLKPAKDLRWLAFDTERTERRVSLGRQTNGLVFSARSGYEQQDVLDFILEHMTYCNVKGYDAETLLEKISVFDVSTLIWGFAVTNYIDGFPVKIPCLSNPSKCQHVTDAIMRIRNMSWVNSDKLNSEQIKFLADYKTDRTEDDLKKYQSSGIFETERTVKVDDWTTVTLRIPSAAHNLFCSRRWIEEVTEAIDGALSKSGRGENVADNKRLTHLLRGLEESQLREYVSWIKEIKVDISDEDSATSDSIDDIEAWCEEKSSDTDVTTKLYDAIKEYMGDMTVSVIGYPAFKCPSCEGGVDIGDSEFVNADVDSIVTLDPLKYFLALMVRKLEATKLLLPTNRMGR